MSLLGSVTGKFSPQAQVKSGAGSAVGQQAFVMPGTYTWVCPPGVTSVCAVAVGGGASGYRTWANYGGGGGGLGWKNNIPVSPGTSYTVVVGDGGRDRNGQSGGTSYFINTSTVAGYGGGNQSSGAQTGGPNSNGTYGGGYVGDGGGAGGTHSGRAGCGAGGYTGRGGNANENYYGNYPSFGGGHGGGDYSSTYGQGGGGGVGIWGAGPSGYYFTNWTGTSTSVDQGGGGNGGSGGGRGHYGENPFVSYPETWAPCGGNFGGGGSGGGTSWSTMAGAGGVGAVRLIWGQGRAFPSTNAGDLADNLLVPNRTTGDAVYTRHGSYTWVCPPGVTSVSVVCVGGGSQGYNPWTGEGGGGGGGLGYKNNYPVTPGTSYTVVVGRGGINTYGGTSYFINTSVVSGGGGGSNYYGSAGGPNTNSTYGGGYTGDGGGSGGYASYVGGSGAGGYTGNGGSSANAGSGGGGGGGHYYSSTNGGGAGGGVGLYGQGGSGQAYNTGWYAFSGGNNQGYGAGGAWVSGVPLGSGCGGSGGSGGGFGYGGQNPFWSYSENYNGSSSRIKGGACGGGGGGGGTSGGGGPGGTGGVRIVWPGSTRQFPSTNVGDAIGDTWYGRGYWGGSSGPNGRGNNSQYAHFFGVTGAGEPNDTYGS